MEFLGLFSGLVPVLAEAAEESGFGFEFDVLEANIINLVIVIFVLVYFGRAFLGKILGERRVRLETAITDAEQRKQKAAAALAEQQQKLAQAQVEAKKILATAETNAAAAKVEILAQADRDIERLQASAAQDLSSQQDRIMLELKQRIAALALEKAEAELPERLDDDTQQRLIDRSISSLGE
mgnify:CR=1 FL=1